MPTSDDLKLAVVIEALLNAKGFEQAQEAIKRTAAQAGAAAGPMAGAGDAAKKMGESFGGTRGPVADVTRLLLMNAGVTGAAGEAAKAAGTAMYFMEGAATAANVAITGGVAAIAFLLPMLIKWASGTEEQKKEQVELKKEIDATIPIIESYARQVKVLNEAARLQLSAKRNETLRAEAIETEHLKDETEVMGRIQQNQIAAGMVLWQKDIDAQEKRRGRLMDLLEAQRQGITVEELYEARIKASNEAQDKAKEAAADRAKAQENLNKAIEEGIQGQSDTRLRGIQAALDKDSEAIRKREERARMGALDPEVARLLVIGDAEQQLAADRAKLENEERKRIQEDIDLQRLRTASIVGGYAQAGAALAEFFGQNKALAIAAAIADTYAGATAALGMKPWTPVNFAMAAAVIAQGLANVQHIRHAGTGAVGFDDPFADLTARRLGRRSAEDFAKHFGSVFTSELPGAMMRQMVTHHYHITNDRSTRYDIGGVHGLVAGSPTAFARGLDRALNKTDRFRRRTTLGR